MSCRSGCVSQDHGSWGECLRAANLSSMGLESTSNSIALGRRTDRELEAYRAARKEGIQPASTRGRDIQTAVRLSDSVGKAFNATDGSFKG